MHIRNRTGQIINMAWLGYIQHTLGLTLFVVRFTNQLSATISDYDNSRAIDE
jgi:hypothetical protein